MLLRVLKPLSTGHIPGQVVDAGAFKDGVVPKLERAGAISIIKSPPLSELPGWQSRAEILNVHAIRTVEEFICTDSTRLKDIFNYKTTRTISKWKKELRNWVNIPDAIIEKKK